MNVSNDAFLKERQSGLGGSDIATLFGINPFSTKLELYLQKRGEIKPHPDNSRTKAGKVMEQVIAAMVSERTGSKLRRVNKTLRHPEHGFLIAHIDRDFVGISKGLEIKNVSPRMGYLWGKDGQPDAIAEYYVPQPHHYMLILDYPAFDVAAYFGGDDLRIYPMERDPEMDEIIIETAHDFWHKHVLAGVPPEPEFDHPATLPMFKRLYPGTNGATIEADEIILHWAKVAQDAAKRASEYEKVAEGAKNHLLAFMGEAAVLKLDSNKVFRRKSIQKKPYTVEATSYIDARFGTTKE
ncbi:YqaJ viral recombinase family protein [Mycoavidus sp. HKI]|uniref:YqaJ viral recombinase family nuclease n=1 Tax=Mycoavidus sp. HKI TaxID=2840467 RepID=UPI001CC1659B|nr:YqaJ viral recombinase family protein [Mycoavidus sp. HKI]UAW63464.1 YqaJ viral recombinase family protein [Mycoavidus sp. HKI]